VDDQVAPLADSVEPAPCGADVLARLAGELHSFHQRSAHRETVIDRLHEENQLLRLGLRRSILEPVVVDLVRLYDGLSRQAGRPGGEMALFASFADDVLLALERCGVDPFTADLGDTYTVGLHVVAGFVDCDDPFRHNTVAEVVVVGLRDRETGVVRRPLRARFHRLPAAGRGSVPVAEHGPSEQDSNQPSDRSQG
jgi:molecular chaperone GrpE